MNCELVISLLADYLDGKVTESEKAMVTEHLRGCDACGEELKFLKKYKKLIREYPTLKTPDDFLKKVHQGIDARNRGGIVRKLFFPLRIKVPLEAAALLALGLTGLLIFKPYRTDAPEYAAEQRPAASEKTTEDRTAVREDVRRGAPPLQAKKGADADRKKADRYADSEQEGTNVIVSSTPEGPSKEKKTEAVGYSEIALTLNLKAVTAEEQSAGGSLTVDKLETARASGSTAGKESPSLSDRAGVNRAKKAVTVSRERNEVDAIDALARSLDGKIISRPGVEKTGLPRVVIVEIPAGNLDQFMSGLRDRWNVVYRPQAGHPRPSGMLRINMDLRK
jgi:hypothetical protein